MDTSNTPLLGAREVRRGRLSRLQLSSGYQRVLPGVYLPNDVQLTAVHRAHSAWVWARGRAVSAGRSAAALWGVTGIPADAPAAIATAAHLRPPPDLEVYRTTLADDEHTEWLTFRLTSPARTAFELGRRLPSPCGTPEFAEQVGSEPCSQPREPAFSLRSKVAPARRSCGHGYLHRKP